MRTPNNDVILDHVIFKWGNPLAWRRNINARLVVSVQIRKNGADACYRPCYSSRIIGIYRWLDKWWVHRNRTAANIAITNFVSLSLIGERSGERLHVTLRADPPLSGPICVDNNITFTCLVRNADYQHHYQYQWSVDGDTPKIGNQSFTLQVTSQSVVNVTCEVYAHQNGGNEIQYGASSVTVQPNGKPPIHQK